MCSRCDDDGDKGVRVVRVEANGEREHRTGAQGYLGRGHGRSQGPSLAFGTCTPSQLFLRYHS